MPNTELRTLCSLDHEPDHDEHVHRCPDPACNTTWRHDNDIPGRTTSEEFDEAHSCPKCGSRQTNKFWAKPPSEERIFRTLFGGL